MTGAHIKNYTVNLTNKLDELFKRWIKNDNDKEFTKDGIIDEKKWGGANHILFILKEPSAPLQKSIEDAIRTKIVSENESETIKTLCDLIRVAWKGVRYRTFNSLGVWAYGLMNINKTFEEANKKGNKDEAFLGSAIMNLKKTPNNICNYKKLCDYVNKNKKHIKDEIDIIDPDIAICCGTFDILREKGILPFRKINDFCSIYKITERKDITFLRMCHPADRHKKGEDKYKELIENYKSVKHLATSINSKTGA